MTKQFLKIFSKKAVPFFKNEKDNKQLSISYIDLAKFEEMEEERKSDREILERMEHLLTRQEYRANESDKILMENIPSIQQLAMTKQKNSLWYRLFNK